MIDFLKKLNGWWDARDVKSKFWYWLIALVLLPLVLAGLGLFGLYVVFSLLLVAVRAVYLFGPSA